MEPKAKVKHHQKKHSGSADDAQPGSPLLLNTRDQAGSAIEIEAALAGKRNSFISGPFPRMKTVYADDIPDCSPGGTRQIGPFPTLRGTDKGSSVKRSRGARVGLKDGSSASDIMRGADPKLNKEKKRKGETAGGSMVMGNQMIASLLKGAKKTSQGSILARTTKTMFGLKKDKKRACDGLGKKSDSEPTTVGDNSPCIVKDGNAPKKKGKKKALEATKPMVEVESADGENAEQKAKKKKKKKHKEIEKL